MYIDKEAGVASVLKSSFAPALTTAVTGGLMYGSHQLGASNARKNVISQAALANRIENRAISDKYREYDRRKTNAMAQYYNNKLNAKTLEKKSALEKIAEDTYSDEMEKISRRAVRKYIGKSLLGAESVIHDIVATPRNIGKIVGDFAKGKRLARHFKGRANTDAIRKNTNKALAEDLKGLAGMYGSDLKAAAPVLGVPGLAGGAYMYNKHKNKQVS